MTSAAGAAFADCYADAVAASGVSASTFAGIQSTESGTNASTCTAAVNAKVHNTNTNGTTDYGCMQINSSNFASLASSMGYPSAAAFQAALLSDPCVGYAAAAKVLNMFARTCASRTGGTTSDYSVACAYNRGFAGCKMTSGCAYADKVTNGVSNALSGTYAETTGKTYSFSCPVLYGTLENMMRDFQSTVASTGTSSSSSGSSTTTTYVDPIRQASQAAIQKKIAMLKSVGEQASPRDFWKLYCFQGDVDVIDLSGKALSSYIGNLIYGILENIIEQYSQYVCSWAQFYVSEITSKLCIPIPQFNYHLSLQNKLAKRCGGNTVALVKIPTGVGMLTTKDISTYFSSMKMNQ